MINLNLTGRNLEITNKLKDYVSEQLGELDKYLPRRMRQAAQGHVTLELDPSGREDNQYVCEAIVTVPGTTLQAKEGTISIYASIDVVEAKLKAQMHTYKDKHTAKPRGSKVLARLIGRTAETDSTVPPSV